MNYNKTILITGSSTGFGKLTALLLASKGYSIIATMRNIKEHNFLIAKELSEIKNISVKQIDVTNSIEIQETINEILHEHKKIDVLINNAGVYGSGLQEAYSINQVKKMFEINVYGTLRMNQAVLPSMRKQKNGLIINISSSVGLVSVPFISIYSASKHALEGLVTGSYPEYIKLGIENILIEPGAYPTEIFQKNGINSDLTYIQNEYNGLHQEIKLKNTQNMQAILNKFNPNPNAIPNKILELLKCEKGKRPVRNYICEILGKKVCDEIIESRNKEMQKMNDGYKT